MGEKELSGLLLGLALLLPPRHPTRRHGLSFGERQAAKTATSGLKVTPTICFFAGKEQVLQDHLELSAYLPESSYTCAIWDRFLRLRYETIMPQAFYGLCSFIRKCLAGRNYSLIFNLTPLQQETQQVPLRSRPPLQFLLDKLILCLIIRSVLELLDLAPQPLQLALNYPRHSTCTYDQQRRNSEKCHAAPTLAQQQIRHRYRGNSQVSPGGLEESLDEAEKHSMEAHANAKGLSPASGCQQDACTREVRKCHAVLKLYLRPVVRKF